MLRRRRQNYRRRFVRPLNPNVPGAFIAANNTALRNLFRTLRGRTIRIRQVGDDGYFWDNSGDITVTTYGRFKDDLWRYIPEEGFEGWIPALTDYRGYTEFYTATPIPWMGDYEQQFREGITNCLLKPIDDWVQTLEASKVKLAAQRKLWRLEDKYGTEGVPQYALNEICEELNININILAPVSKRLVRQGRTNKKKARKTFNLDNSYQNHVSVETEELLLEDDELDNWELQKNDLYWLTPHKNKKRTIYKVRRGDTTYYAKTPDEKFKFYKKFKGFGGFNWEKHPELKAFIENSIHYTGALNWRPDATELIDARACRHIDQAKAYASFKKCGWYEGFMFRPSLFASTDKIHEIGIYLITDIELTPELRRLNQRLEFINNNNAYPSPFLKWLLSKGVTFRVVAGCWGVRMDFDFPECMIKDGSYAIWAGCCDSVNPNKCAYIYDADPRWLADVEEKVVSWKEGEYQILLEKERKTYKGHLTSFIVGYSYINTLEQLLQFDDWGKVLRVVGDGIYFCGDPPELVGSFVFKEDGDDYKSGGGCAEAYFSRLQRHKGEDTTKLIPNGNTNFRGFIQYDEHPDFLQERILTTVNKFNLTDVAGNTFLNPHLEAGAGGTGKSHAAATSPNFMLDPVFLFPSHDLREALAEKYPHIRTMTHQRLLQNSKDKITGEPTWLPFVTGCGCAIIDEGSMLNATQINEMVELLRPYGIFVIVLADLEYQLEPIHGRPADKSDFASVRTFLTDYRSINQKTKDKKQRVRDLMDQGKSLQYIMDDVIDEWGNTDGYTKEDTIIASQHRYCHEHTAKFAAIEKYRVVEPFQKYNTGQVLFEKPTTKQTDKYELRHGYTIHGVQGKTTTTKLFIDTRGMRSCRMFYTAVSRCRDWDTLVFLK